MIPSPIVTIKTEIETIVPVLKNITIFEYDNYGLCYNNKYLIDNKQTLSFIKNIENRNIVLCPNNEVGILFIKDNYINLQIGQKNIKLGRTF